MARPGLSARLLRLFLLVLLLVSSFSFAQSADPGEGAIRLDQTTQSWQGQAYTAGSVRPL